MAVEPRRQPASEETRGWQPVIPGGLILVAGVIAGMLAGATVIGGSPSPLTWYVARAAGLSLYLLFWLSLVSGLGMTTRRLDRLGGRAVVWQIHRFTTEVGVVLLGLHMASLAIDPAVPLGLRGVLLPLASGVRQPWTDFGVVAAMGFAGLTASFALRRFLGHRGWRVLHYAAFPLWLLALLHGIGAGSDSRAPWVLAMYVVTTAIVVFLTASRLLARRRTASGSQIA